MKFKDFLNKILKPAGLMVVGRGDVNVGVKAGIGIHEKGRWCPSWKIEKYDRNMILYAVDVFYGNCLLNEGITELLKLLGGITATEYSEANAYIGVGNSDTAAAASQEGLQGSSKEYAAMDSGYPQVSDQTITFRSTFGAGEAAFHWEEFTVVNASTDSGDNLCRKVDDHSTKPSDDTWVVSMTVTIS